MFYNARWYDTTIGHFAQADNIPLQVGDTQSLDRFAYATNNPVKYADPTGHWIESVVDIAFIIYDVGDIAANGLNWENGLSLVADVAGLALPGLTGGGLAVRAAMHADDAVKAANAVDNVIDAANAVDNTLDTANSTDNLGDALNTLGNCPNSFSADTDVITLNGAQDIVTIQVGDYVLAWNEAENSLGFYPVTATIHYTDQVIIELIVAGEHIETTPEHPFYVEGQGWVDAKDLISGMYIRRSDGTTGMVWLQWTTYRQQEMYNLTVDTAHTFFVGDGQWLVHNTGGPCPPTNIQAIEDHLKRLDPDDATSAMVQRLKDGKSTYWDQNFADHELAEALMMDNGMRYEFAHPAALKQYGIKYDRAFAAHITTPMLLLNIMDGTMKLLNCQKYY